MHIQLLHHLKKPKAKSEILILQDFEFDSDGWFVLIKWIDKRGKEVKRSVITTRDIPDWIKMFISDGWQPLNIHI